MFWALKVKKMSLLLKVQKTLKGHKKHKKAFFDNAFLTLYFPASSTSAFLKKNNFEFEFYE